MVFFSTTFIKIFLILFISSYIAIAGPVPDLVGNGLSVEGREQASGGSVSSSEPAAGGGFLGLSGKDGHGGKAEDHKKKANHNKGVGGSSLAGTRHKQGNTDVPADPFGAIGEPPQGESEQGGSEQGGSVSGVGGGGSFLSILSGNGGAGGGDRSGISLLDILNKRKL